MLLPLTLRQTFQRYRKRSKRLMTNKLRWVKSWSLRKMSLRIAKSSFLKKFTLAQLSPKPITLSWRNILLPKKLSGLVSKRNLLEILMHLRKRLIKCHSWLIVSTLKQNIKKKLKIRSSLARTITSLERPILTWMKCWLVHYKKIMILKNRLTTWESKSILNELFDT